VFSRHRSAFARPAESILATRSILSIGLIAFGLALPATSASAQGPRGLFDFLFAPRTSTPPSASSYADPNAPTARPDAGPRYDSGSAVAYCVRLCDGRFFPIQRSSGANAAQVCNSSCPATRTKVYSGGVINHAVAQDGTRYADLPSAFAYRDRMVTGCSCNGKDAYGLVTPTTDEDPTLRAGDIVATDTGFVAYAGVGAGKHAEFTSIDAAGLSGEFRQRLAGTKTLPRNATPVPEHTSVSSAGDRRVQLGR
jgi:hypothetical protein